MSIEIDISIGPVVPVPVANMASGAPVIGENVILFGYTAVETTGAAAASFTLKSGDSVVEYVNLAQGTSDSASHGTHGVWCKTGIQLGTVTGSPAATLYLAYVQP